VDIFWFVTIGFALGFGVVFLVRLGQGYLANCAKCGQQHWVSPKKLDSVCKKCGAPLRIQKKSRNKTGNKSKRKQ